MIISLDARKYLTSRLQCQFIIKHSKMGTEVTYLNMTKAMYDNSRINIVFNSIMVKAFPLKSKNKTRMPTFTTYIQQSTESPNKELTKKNE